MDGAPDVTQPPIQPGGTFRYEFVVPDAGTYWYHPHAHSSEQVGHGLAGPLIVLEPNPPVVDRDIVWMLGDFRLQPDGAIAGGFNNPMETSMSGRVGNTVTVNGHTPKSEPVRSGERLRLRLINAAPARIFALDFQGLAPMVMAYDGQPVEPHPPEGGRIVLGPAMRIDLILDMRGRPGETSAVQDSFYEGLPFTLATFTYSLPPMTARAPLPPPAKLAANPIPEPDLATASRQEVVLTGGMGMGGMANMNMSTMMGGSGGMGMMMGGMMSGPMWEINGVAAHDHAMEPLITLRRDASALFAVDNRTAWYHPIHLHGHSFRVITRNGTPTRFREWRDTVLIPPREKAELAFVADNPGDWMFHCHILDQQEGGMMAVIRVA
jgi:FtsP/CotA-like multicopper oxidase with cupredoxin domain